MSVSKVSVNGNTLIDISDTTATAADVSGDKVFYTASGLRTTGTGSGYVSKAGDTMTGELKAPVLTVESSGSWPSYGFIADAEEAYAANILFDNQTHKFNFVCKNSSADTYNERYYLPAADSGLTENTSYDILTTKAPVSVQQGGTGETTPSAALAALGGLPKAGGVMTGRLEIQADPWDYFRFGSASGDSRGSFIIRQDNSFHFNEIHPSGVGTECYLLPAPTNTSTTAAWYDIVTTKTAGNIISAEKSTASDIANATYTDITSMSYTAGTYVLIGTVLFGTNANGYRQILISTTSGGSAKTNRWAEWKGAPTNGSQTIAEVMTIVKLLGSGTLYLKAYQTSGGALSTSGGLIAVRIV